MANLVEVEVVTNEEQLAKEALAKLIELVEAGGITGYEPSEANLEVILLRVIALMAANAANIASVVPLAILRAFGTELIKLPFNEGAQATASTTWTVVPEAAVRQIPAGFTIEAGGLAFAVENETEVKASVSTVTVQVIAVERGSNYNKIEGVAEQTNPLDWVTEVQIIGETTGGASEETDEEYLVRLVAALALQAPRPITATDYASFVLDVPSTVIGIGVKVGRATSIDGYNLETKEENIERCVTTFVTNPEGKPLTKGQMEAIETWLRSFREVNFLAFVSEASYSKVYITTKVHVLGGYSTEAVLANVKSALIAAINPEVWGNPSRSTTGGNQWVNEKPSKVRYNYIIGVIESVPGVAYVFPGSEGLKIGTSPTPTGTTDIELTGPAPLPETTNTTVLATAG